MTRLSPRTQGAHLLVREGLLCSLEAERHRRLIIVEAPAGYGKTNLLSQWRERQINDGAIVGWLTLDPDDRNVADFIVYVLHALIRGGLQYDGPLFENVSENDASIKRYFRLLLNAIAAETRPVVLMLDEFEHLGGEAVGAIISQLLRYAPDHFLLVIATRQSPPLKLALMKAQGVVKTFVANELRFTRAEIETLFEGTLSERNLKAIENRTDGWPVMLQLLRGVWRESANPPGLLSDLEGLADAASDYLSEQVISELPVSVQSALIRTSMLDALSAGAFEALLGNNHEWHAVSNAAPLRPFLVAADNDLPTCRLHPVVRSFLQSRFQGLPSAEQRDLSQKAAIWYARANRFPKAVRLALQAGDIGLAGSIMENAGGVQIWIRKGFSLIRQLEELLTPELVGHFPRLQLMRALVYMKTGRTKEARTLYENVRQKTGDFTRDREGGNDNALRLDSMIIDTTLLVNECRAADDEYLARHEQTTRLISGDDDTFLGHAKILLCLTAHQKGHFPAALYYADECIVHYRRANALHGEFFANLHKGVVHFATGQPKLALADYQQARNIWHRNFGDDRNKFPLVTPLTMEVHYETGAQQPVLGKLRESYKGLHHSEGWLDIFAAEFSVAAMAALSAEGLDSALRELDKASEDIENRQLEGIIPVVQATRVSCLALSGELAAAGEELAKMNFTPERYALVASSPVPWREREAVLLAVARVWLREGRQAEVIAMLAPLIAPLDASGIEKTACRFRLLLALAYVQAGEHEAFLTVFELLLVKVRRHGYIRGFLEEGVMARDALTIYLTTDMPHHADAFAVKTAAEISALVCARETQGHSATLTVRERDVLQSLAGGHSDKVIARDLGLTHNTVRFHLKNIYSKLGARNRLGAVQVARQRELIS